MNVQKVLQTKSEKKKEKTVKKGILENKKKNKKSIDIEEEEEEIEEEQPIIKNNKNKKIKESSSKDKKKTNSKKKVEVSESENESDEDESEDEAPKSRKGKSKSNNKNTKPRKPEESDSSEEEVSPSGDSENTTRIKSDKDITSPTVETIYNQVDKTTTILSTNEKQTRREGIILNTSPLSDASSEYTANLYKILSHAIPTLVEQEGFYSNSNRPSSDYDVLTRSGDLLINAYTKYSSNLQIMRYKQNLDQSIKGWELPDINDLEAGSGIINATAVRGAKNNQSRTIDKLVSRLLNSIKAFKMVHKVILSAPSKQILINENIDDEFDHLFRYKPAVNDNVHVYYAGYRHDVEWMKREIVETMIRAPASFGELAVTSNIRNIKIAADWALTTDQYTAAILTNNALDAEDNAISGGAYLNMLRASNMNLIQTISYGDPAEKTYAAITLPTQENIDSLWVYMMTSTDAKLEKLNFIINEIQNTGRLKAYTIEEVYDMNDRPSSVEDQALQSAIRSGFAIQADPAKLIALETLSDDFDFRLSEMAVPSAPEVMLQIHGLLAFPVVCPRIFQKIICEWGYAMMVALEHLVGISVFNDYVEDHGWTRVQQNENWITRDTTKTKLITSQTPDNIRPSILTPLVGNPRGNATQRDLYRLIARIQALCRINFYEHRLNLKEAAAVFPYHSIRYVANMSWEPNTFDQVQAHQGSMYNRVANIQRILKDLDALYNSIQGNHVRLEGTKDWFNAYVSVSAYAADSARFLFNYTCADIQKWIMEGPCFIYDGVRTDDVYNAPHLIGIGATSNINQPVAEVDGIQLLPIPVQLHEFTIDIMEPLNFLLCVEGDIMRPVAYSANIGNAKFASPNKNSLKKKTITPVNPLSMVNFFYDQVRRAEVVSLPLRLTSWLMHPDEPNNPIRDISRGMRPGLILNNWKGLVEEMFKVAGAGDWTHYINVLTKHGTIEPRFLIPMITHINKNPPGTRMIINEANGRFNQIYELLDQNAMFTYRTCARLWMSNDSPFLLRQNGFVLGKFGVADRDVIISQNSIRLHFPNQVEWNDIAIQYRETHQGNVLNLTINDIEFDSPFDPNLKGYIININNVSVIPDNVLGWLIQAIHFGNIALRIKNKEVSYKIVDFESKVQHFNEEMTTSKLSEILQSEDGSELKHVFETTTFANNFISNQAPVMGYIQWIGFEKLNQNTVLSAVITSTAEPPVTHVPLDPENWGYGRWQEYIGFMPLTDIPKLESPKINLNNKVRCWLENMYKEQPKFHFRQITIEGLN